MQFRTTMVAFAVCLATMAAATAATDPKAGPKAARPQQRQAAVPAPVQIHLPSMTAQQIVERNAAARGGAAAWQRVTAMTMSGKLDAGKVRKDGGQLGVVSKQDRARAKAEMRRALQGGAPLPVAADKTIQLPFQMELKRPVMTRLEVPFRGETAVQVFDGANGWKLRPYLGRHEVEPFTDDEMKVARSQQELDGPLINHKTKGTAVELDGAEMVDGRGAYKLKLTLKNGDVRHLWVDAKTFLDLKIDAAPRRWDGKMRQMATYYRDYKQVDGLMIPHRFETVLEGVRGSENIYIEKVALNPAISNARFAKPQ